MPKRSEEGARSAQDLAPHESSDHASGPTVAPMRDSASARGPLSAAPSPQSQGSQFSYQRVMLKPSGGPRATGSSTASTAQAGFSQGQSIPLPHKASMEQSFGTSFSNVKATVAPEATASLGAEAYAKGNSVAFSTPNPGKGTVAHELTHVVQQSGGLGGQGDDGTGIPLGPSSASTTAGAEAEADAVAAKVATGAAVGAGDISSADPTVAKLSVRGALGAAAGAVGQKASSFKSWMKGGDAGAGENEEASASGGGGPVAAGFKGLQDALNEPEPNPEVVVTLVESLSPYHRRQLLGTPAMMSGLDTALTGAQAKEVKQTLARPPKGKNIYVLKKGDTLGKLAMRATGDPLEYKRLMKFNHLATHEVAVGDWLVVPKDWDASALEMNELKPKAEQGDPEAAKQIAEESAEDISSPELPKLLSRVAAIPGGMAKAGSLGLRKAAAYFDRRDKEGSEEDGDKSAADDAQAKKPKVMSQAAKEEGKASQAARGRTFEIGLPRMAKPNAKGDKRKIQVRAGKSPKKYKPDTHRTDGALPLKLKVKAVNDKTRWWDCTADPMWSEFRSYVQIVTLPNQSEVITEKDDKWTRIDFLHSTQQEDPVAFGDDDSSQDEVAERLGLPPGRKPGSSKAGWSTSQIFSLSEGGKNLDGDLYSRVTAMLDWAIQNDMLAADALMTDGVRSPQTAHKMSVAFNIQHKPSRLQPSPLEVVSALPNGRDADGNVWFEDGDTEQDVRARAKKVRASGAEAAEGYTDAGAAAPNPGDLYVSNHTTGKAIDVFIPWRKRKTDASTNAWNAGDWEEIYNQFGLHRPMDSEDWHVEMISKPIKKGVEEA